LGNRFLIVDKAGIYIEYLPFKEKHSVNIILQMLEKKLNCPDACSIGRIFDGVSALLGICETISTEAEAAQKLEETALKTENFYKIDIEFKENEKEIIIST